MNITNEETLAISSFTNQKLFKCPYRLSQIQMHTNAHIQTHVQAISYSRLNWYKPETLHSEALKTFFALSADLFSVCWLCTLQLFTVSKNSLLGLVGPFVDSAVEKKKKKLLPKTLTQNDQVI